MKHIITSVVFLCLSWFATQGQNSNVGKRYPSEKTTYIDRSTGMAITVLTTSPFNDSKIYQTHPQWTSDGKYIIFRSNRSGAGLSQAFAANEVTGEIVQLTDDPGINAVTLNVARKSMRLYYLRGKQRESRKLVELNLDSLLKDSENNKMKPAKAYERTIVTFSDSIRDSGGFSIDADEKFAYMGIAKTKDIPAGPVDTAINRRKTGVAIPQHPGGIYKVDLKSGEISVVVNTPFTMGHVQANPFVPGEILYCNETGGDAPQRMWIVKVDGTGNRPLYKETPEEWITHETWVDANHVYFNTMAHLSRLRTRPTGIFSVNVRTDEVRVLGQVSEGNGFWHCNGSSDGKWAVGDNFAGNVYLIDCKTGEKTLLTTDHKMKPDHTHPTFSPDNKRILFQSGYLSDGKSLDIMIISIPS